MEEVRFKQYPKGVESNYCLKMNVSLAYAWEAELLPWTKDTILLYKMAKGEQAICNLKINLICI